MTEARITVKAEYASPAFEIQTQVIPQIMCVYEESCACQVIRGNFSQKINTNVSNSKEL